MAMITIENHHDCYEYGKAVHSGATSKSAAIGELVRKGMSRNSASYYLSCVCAMLDGKCYTATVNQTATSYFLTEIYAERGAGGLRLALQSLRLHLDYQKGKNTLPSLEKLYSDFYEIL